MLKFINNMKFNYSKICSDLLRDLSQRAKEVVLRRFGLESDERETLEAIGESQGITRERVRQIQEDAILRIKPEIEKHQPILDHFTSQINAAGNLKREDVLLNLLGGEKFQNHIFFLLTLGEPFLRFAETNEHYSFWTTEPKSLNFAQKTTESFYNFLLKKKEPLSLGNLSAHQILGGNLERETINRLSLQAFQSFLEISKKIEQNQEGLFGLKDWPEINPRGIRDLAYLVFKKEKTPLHFTKVANLIGNKCNPQSVHNELIRDPRFVLVGRGLYALREWGYKPGVVKDIIIEVLKETKKPLSKEEILEKVLKQRVVKENTISLNLNSKKYFSKTSEGKYTLANKKI